MQRRDVLKIIAGSAVLRLTAAEPGASLYFTRDEFAALDQLTEMIIPADDHSPGAHQAGVAAYIDRSVAEAFLPEDKLSWRKGLAAYLPLSKEQRQAMLTKVCAKEADPQTDAEKFFGQLKDTTIFAYYTSSIGIHQDIQYVGNVIQEQFTGYDAT